MKLHRKLIGSLATAALLCLALFGAASLAQEAPKDLGDPWIHDDIEMAYDIAFSTGKPLLVAFR